MSSRALAPSVKATQVLMHKKILLAASAFLVAALAYWAFSSGDRTTRRTTDGLGVEAVRQFVSVPTTQGTQRLGDSRMPISPGDESRVIVYDDATGRPKYQFEAEGWRPINDTDYHVDKLLITIYMARGETTHITAAEADVTLAQKAKNRVDVQRGILRGGVRVVIDRTTTQWREENPERADMKSHPDDLITIDLESARFDMDRAELISDGGVVVDSREARIEDVSGLTVNWNLVDNRVEVLQFARGGRMTIRRGANMVEFGLPGGERKRKSDDDAIAASDRGVDGAAGPGAGASHTPLARANKPMSIDTPSAQQAAAAIRLEGARFAANSPQSIQMEDDEDEFVEDDAVMPVDLRSPEALAADMDKVRRETQSALASDAGAASPAAGTGADDQASQPATGAKRLKNRPKRIHTYRALFSNEVVVEQMHDGASVGRLEADKLEVHFDFGGQQRQMASSAGDKPKSPGVRANQPMAAGPSPTSDTVTTPVTASVTAAPPPVERSDLDAARTDLDDDDEKGMVVLTWNGPLELRPLHVPPTEQTGRRFDVIAIGDPVVVRSERGNARCDQLVYRGERKQIWLLGNLERPVDMAVDEHRRLSGVEVFFDRRRGLGRVEGAGYMIDSRGEIPGADQRADRDGAAARTVALQDTSTNASETPAKPRDPVEIRWSRGVDLEIGERAVERINAETGAMEYKTKEYLRRAWFHGDTKFSRGDEKLEAEEVAATFGVPPAQGDASDFIEHLNMVGGVRMVRENDLIEAERLDVQLVRTPDGRNAPRIVDAAGKVIARQKDREIRADEMHVVLTSFPGVTHTAPDDKTQITSKPRLGMESLDATGDVFAVDPAHNMKIRDAQSLNIVIRNGEELVRTTIVSPSPKSYAKARFQDMAIHGHRIEIDADKQSVDVPGPGRAWMVTYEDFGGRRLAKPTPVKTTWTGRMQLRLEKDYGVFVDNVRSSTDEFTLNCDKLTVRLAKAEPKPAKPKTPNLLDRFAVLADIVDDRADIEFKDNITIRMEQKRPVYVVAEGNAEAISSTYAPHVDGKRGRLLSRARIAGRQIVADLRSEQMSVPCEGNLLIEDYQFDDQDGKRGQRRTAQVGNALMSSVRGDGPSQSLIEWENAMDFFVDRALATFDRNVRMIHLSGQQVVMKDELAEAFKLDPSALRRVGEGRRAELTCGNLLIEFATGKSDRPSNDTGATSQMIRATDLERMIARDAVHLQDGTKSLMGEYLQYLAYTNEVRLEGGPGLDARIIDQAEGGRFNMWRGPLLIWNRATNAIQAPRSTVTAGGR